MPQNLQSSQSPPLSFGNSCRLMLELRDRMPEAKVVPIKAHANAGTIPVSNSPSIISAIPSYDQFKNFTKEEHTDYIEQRRARRTADKAAKKAEADAYRQQQQELKRIRREEQKLEAARIAEEKCQARLAKGVNPRKKVEPGPYFPLEDARTGGPRDLYLKPLPPKAFEPQIGKPNAAGETPVRLDHKTVILVPQGKDIQKVIQKYQKILNIKV